jgi:anti-sigma regulatory factor (Ser/Thr protein kinase)
MSARAPSGGRRHRHRPSRPRVLLVDRNDGSRRALSTLLAEDGFDVIGGVTDGEAAIRLAAIGRPRFVVLDLRLPDVAGRELLRRLRAALPDADVVLFSVDDHGGLPSVDAGPPGDMGTAPYGAGRLVEILGGFCPVEARQATVEVVADIAAPGEARRFAASQLVEWGRRDMVDDASLVVSELVTNAVVRCDDPVELHLVLAGSVLRIEVRDAARGDPDVADQSPDRIGGRGLAIVAALSAAWGIGPSPRGKVVWAALAP